MTAQEFISDTRAMADAMADGVGPENISLAWEIEGGE